MAYAGIGRALIRLAPWITHIAYDIYLASEIKDAPEGFEFRRLQIQIQRDTGDDVCVNSLDFVNITSGAVDTTWTNADFTAVEGRVSTFLTGSGIPWSPAAHAVSYRWYDMPRPAGGEPRPPVRIAAGPTDLGGGTTSLPQQVCMSVSKITALRRHWGRVYLGPLQTNALASLTNSGEFDHAKVDSVATGFQLLITGTQADDFPMVVYDRARGALHTVNGTRCDNIPDVQRRRRIEESVYRKVLP